MGKSLFPRMRSKPPSTTPAQNNENEKPAQHEQDAGQYQIEGELTPSRPRLILGPVQRLLFVFWHCRVRPEGSCTSSSLATPALARMGTDWSTSHVGTTSKTCRTERPVCSICAADRPVEIARKSAIYFADLLRRRSLANCFRSALNFCLSACMTCFHSRMSAFSTACTRATSVLKFDMSA
jgi:hypothetical protein